MYSSQLILEIDAAAAARQVRLLPPVVWRVLRLFDGHRTLVQAIDDSPMERATTLSVVRRLTELGLVREAGQDLMTRREAPQLSARTKEWLATRKRAARQPDLVIPADDDGVEAALDEILTEHMPDWVTQRDDAGVEAALDEVLTEREPQWATPSDDDELEAALDEVLAELDADSEARTEAAPDLDGVPEAQEHPLSDALQMTIQSAEWPAAELIESLDLAEKVRRRLEEVHEICDVPHGPVILLDTPDIGFTNLELDFFDSYVPELPDDDDFMDLVMEAAQSHG